jgi:hypothetical protein
MKNKLEKHNDLANKIAKALNIKAYGGKPNENMKELVYYTKQYLNENSMYNRELNEYLEKLINLSKINKDHCLRLLSLLDDYYHESITDSEYRMYGHIYYNK